MPMIGTPRGGDTMRGREAGVMDFGQEAGRARDLQWVLLVVCLVATVLLYWYAKSVQGDLARSQFERLAEQVRNAVAARAEIYAGVLHSARGLILGPESVSPEEWRRFVESLDAANRYAGFGEVIAVSHVPITEHPAFLSRRQQADPRFAITPEGVRPDYLVVTHLGDTAAVGMAPGLDIGTDPVMREAAERARDTGSLAVTGARSANHGVENSVDLYMFLPVYRSSVTPDDLEVRRAALRGWVGARVRSDGLMGGLVGGPTPHIQFQAFDARAAPPGTLLFDSALGDQAPGSAGESVLTETTHLVVGGRTWTLRFVSTPAFEAAHATSQPVIVLIVGIALSFALWSVAHLLATSRARAAAIAERMTQASRESEDRAMEAEQRLMDAIESVSEGFALWDADDRLVLFNNRYRELYPLMADRIRQGARFQDVIRLALERGQFAGVDDVGEWWSRRLEAHLNPRHPAEYALADGRWLLVSERRTADGGVVGVSTDITELKRRETDLERSEERYRSLIELSPNAIIVHKDNRILYVNPAAVALTRAPDNAALIGSRVADLVHPDYRPTSGEPLSAPPEGAESAPHIETKLVCLDGSVIDVEAGLRATTFAGESAQQTILTDITERKRAEAALRESEQRFRDIAGAASDWFWELGADLRFTYVSNRFFTVVPVRRESMLGKTHAEVAGEAQVAAEPKKWNGHAADLAARRPFRDFSYTIVDDDGADHHVRENGVPIIDEAGNFRGYRGTGTNVTELRKAEEQLRRMARHDALTGLPNRYLFMDRLSGAMARSRRNGTKVALLFVDLDNFKPVNDKLGHEAGDLLLRKMADRLTGCVRETDTVARYGGDEFTIIMTDVTDVTAAANVASNLLGAVSNPFNLDGHEAVVGGSIGIAVYPDDAETTDGLIRQADGAMYEAKGQGKNCFRFATPPTPVTPIDRRTSR